MAHNVPWTKPYPGISKLPHHSVKRITVELPMDDAQVILALTMSPFLLPTICQYAIKLTADEIRRLKLTYPDDSRPYLTHICERTFGEFIKDESVGADAGGTAEASAGVTNAESKSTGVGKEVKGGGGDKGGGVGQTKGKENNRRR